ncbi:MAG: hypothetical protein DCO96_04735 [Fluviicola sp. XM-24bin1]|nr:MAG: hypothetical protein DCO96_04735 [Fluviicola sp. XM-24bin1]
MKILGIIGTIVGAIAGILGGYLQFVLVPAADIAESRWRMATSDAYFGSLEHQLDMSTMSAATDFGVIVMGAGLLAFLLSIVPAIKKQKIAWIGVGLGVIMFFLGAAHGTHMFS